jgi:DNA-binding NtrC family response regulator
VETPGECSAKIVLIVDDDPQIRRLCRTVLEKNHYFVKEASNGKEALAALKESVVDVMVLDLSMPEVDGLEVLNVVHVKLPKLKVIAISGFMGGTMLEVAKAYHVAATLTKPFSSDSLLSVVCNLLAAGGESD